MDLLVGTSNPGKLEELAILLGDLPMKLLSLRDVGLADMEVEESATTLEENAGLKVRAYSAASGLLTLADDTGLMVDALGGAPGVYPARYGGPGLTMQQRRQKLLGELTGVPNEKRTARFVCVIAVMDPHSGALETARGVCEGRIAQVDEDGGRGFGYDSVFIPEGSDVPWGHVQLDHKNDISHRARAVRLIKPILLRMAAENS